MAFSTLIEPWLSVRGGAKAVEFYKTAFNAVETYRLETPGGLIVKLSVNGSEFWVSGSAEDAPNVQLPSGNSIRMILDTPSFVGSSTTCVQRA